MPSIDFGRSIWPSATSSIDCLDFSLTPLRAPLLARDPTRGPIHLLLPRPEQLVAAQLPRDPRRWSHLAPGVFSKLKTQLKRYAVRTVFALVLACKNSTAPSDLSVLLRSDWEACDGGDGGGKKTMANARMISREFFTSADLVDLPAAARLLFAGMIVFADDAGVVRDNSVFFARTLCSGIDVRPCRVRGWCDALASRGCIKSVFLEGVKCWRITNFHKFQRLRKRKGNRQDEDEVEDEVEVDDEARAIDLSIPIPIPTKAEPADPRAEVFEFFESELGAKPKHDAWGAIVKLGTTHRDVEEWRKAVLWAREHSRLGAFKAIRIEGKDRRVSR